MRSSASDSQIATQISVLNQDYAIAGISFVLAGTTRTINPDWFNNAGFDNAGRGNSQQTAMKASLRKDGLTNLNIYSVGFVAYILIPQRKTTYIYISFLVSRLIPDLSDTVNILGRTRRTPRRMVLSSSSRPFLVAASLI